MVQFNQKGTIGQPRTQSTRLKRREFRSPRFSDATHRPSQSIYPPILVFYSYTPLTEWLEIAALRPIQFNQIPNDGIALCTLLATSQEEKFSSSHIFFLSLRGHLSPIHRPNLSFLVVYTLNRMIRKKSCSKYNSIKQNDGVAPCTPAHLKTRNFLPPVFSSST